MGDVAGVHRIRGDNDRRLPPGHCAISTRRSTFAGEPLVFRAGHEAPVLHLRLDSPQRGDRGRCPGAVSDVHAPRSVRTPRHGSDGDIGVTTDSRTPCRSTSQRRPWAPTLGCRMRRRWDYSCLEGAGAFLSTPSDLAAPRHCDAEARAAQSRNHRALSDAAPARVRCVRWIRAGLEGRTAFSLARGARRGWWRHRGSLIGGATSLSDFSRSSVW